MEDILQATANSLAHLRLPFRIEEEERGTLLFTDDETRFRLRPRCLEISRVVLVSPTEKQKSIAFWYEGARVAESTFLFVEKEGSQETFRLAVRLPVDPDGKVLKRTRIWRGLVAEALLQISQGEKKIHDGSWGDLKPEEQKGLKK